MPPRTKPTTRSPAKRTKAPPRRRSKTRALTVTDAVRREPLQRIHTSLLADPLSIIEPFRRSIVERQIAFLDAAIAWSPARWIIHQQAAFWDGLAAEHQGQPKRKPHKSGRRH